jgi:hypothetical protein
MVPKNYTPCQRKRDAFYPFFKVEKKNRDAFYPFFI